MENPPAMPPRINAVPGPIGLAPRPAELVRGRSGALVNDDQAGVEVSLIFCSCNVGGKEATVRL